MVIRGWAGGWAKSVPGNASCLEIWGAKKLGSEFCCVCLFRLFRSSLCFPPEQKEMNKPSVYVLTQARFAVSPTNLSTLPRVTYVQGTHPHLGLLRVFVLRQFGCSFPSLGDGATFFNEQLPLGLYPLTLRSRTCFEGSRLKRRLLANETASTLCFMLFALCFMRLYAFWWGVHFGINFLDFYESEI